jgi:DNA polymerase-3 subunit delta'
VSSENWGLLGHAWAVKLLSGQIARGEQRHAYLFTGPQGVGRRTLALRLAQALNCQEPPAPGEFCGDCRACRGFAAMAHTDLYLIQRQEGDRDIKAEAVRELGRSLALSPYETQYQIALLLNFEQANEFAANALLKTLEEPPPRVILLLTAESAEALPATIASRCEVLRLRPLSPDALAEGLQKAHRIPAERARLLAALSGGRPGYALALAEDESLLAQRGEWLDRYLDTLPKGRVERFALAEKLGADRELLRQALLVWLSFWRDVMMRSGMPGAHPANADREAQVASLAQSLGLGGAQRAVAAIERTLDLLETNINPRLAAENLLLELPRMQLAN